MKNVFIAIGGSGTKVAEALVRLLAAGFPTRRENGVVTSAGDSLEIWRVDPDRASGAAVALQKSVDEYAQLQSHLAEGSPPEEDLASSRWAMDLSTNIRFLDPLKLPPSGDRDNEIKSLRGILDSGVSRETSLPLLSPFFTREDLDVEIDRGFYQKPFIGSAVMAIFADSLRYERSPGGLAAGLTRLDSNKVNFFLCGSLHGGTGACGVPVIGRFLKERKNTPLGAGWRLGACMLAPYSLPPQPPFKALPEGEPVTEQMLLDMLKSKGDEPAFKSLNTPEEKRTLITQILLGFYADPDDMESRARQGLTYYKRHSVGYFDETYLVGKPEPDKLTVWSNGGSSQSNPLNSAEIIAAIAALNFFSAANTGDARSYVVGTSTPDLESNKMRLSHLPKYKIDNGKVEVDPEKVFLATAFLHHLLVHQIPWGTKADNWPKNDIPELRAYYKDNESKQENDRREYGDAARLLGNALIALLDPNRAKGWSGEDASEVARLLSGDSATVAELSAKTAKRWMRDEAEGPLTLGKSAIKASTFEFGRWCPPGAQFSRGEYLRFAWSQLFGRGKDAA
jgi:hypothetical protein